LNRACGNFESRRAEFVSAQIRCDAGERQAGAPSLANQIAAGNQPGKIIRQAAAGFARGSGGFL